MTAKSKGMQNALAEAYHTTVKTGGEIDFTGKRTVVGIDLTPGEAEHGRFIYYRLENPANKGTVLLGYTFCDYRIAEISVIRQRAIENASQYVGSCERAQIQVDAVISAGGVLLPSSI